MGQRLLMSVAMMCLAALAVTVVRAHDPESVTDFFVPEGKNASMLDGTYFTFSKLSNVTVTSDKFVTVTLANVPAGFTALTGLGVSNALLTYPPGAINRPHTHPRGTETLFVLYGSLDVGLVDSTNKLFTNTIYRGEIFVFPIGLVHFQINRNDETTVAYSSFSSTNAGTITIPLNVFESGIDEDILAKSFGVSEDVIGALVAGSAPPPM